MTLRRTLLSTAIVALLGTAGVAWAGGNIQAGKAKAGSCAMCHGANGEGGSGAMLAGMKEDKFEQAMKDFKSGKRPNEMMKSFASRSAATTWQTWLPTMRRSKANRAYEESHHE